MSNYAKPLAVDQKGAALQEYPAPYIAQARYNDDNGVASSTISLTPNTTTIEVGAVGGQGLVTRWIPVTETATVIPYGSVISSGVAANFDHFIPPNQYRRLVVPVETIGKATGGGMGIGSVNGLYQRIAIANAGTGPSSVLLSEF